MYCVRSLAAEEARVSGGKGMDEGEGRRWPFSLRLDSNRRFELNAGGGARCYIINNHRSASKIGGGYVCAVVSTFKVWLPFPLQKSLRSKILISIVVRNTMKVHACAITLPLSPNTSPKFPPTPPNDHFQPILSLCAFRPCATPTTRALCREAKHEERSDELV